MDAGVCMHEACSDTLSAGVAATSALTSGGRKAAATEPL